jgi:hypothetical protein
MLFNRSIFQTHSLTHLFAVNAKIILPARQKAAERKANLPGDCSACIRIATNWPSRFLWHEHFQWIFVVSSENFTLENLEMLSVDVVLMFTPRWAAFFVLQAPVNGEERCENLKLIARHEHLVDLSVSRVPVADESLVVLGILVGRNKKWLVKEL